jgi:hypothetical protein
MYLLGVSLVSITNMNVCVSAGIYAHGPEVDEAYVGCAISTAETRHPDHDLGHDSPITLRSRSCGGDRLRTAVGDESAMHRLSFGYSPPWWLGQTKEGKGFFETLFSFHLKMLLRVLFHEFLVVERK